MKSVAATGTHKVSGTQVMIVLRKSKLRRNETGLIILHCVYPRVRKMSERVMEIAQHSANGARHLWTRCAAVGTTTCVEFTSAHGTQKK